MASSTGQNAASADGTVGWSGRLPRFCAIGIVVVLFGLLYGRILFAPAGHAPATAFHDFYSLFYPAATIASNLVHGQEFPLWNPYSFCGAPFLASIQMGVLYPPNWLHAVLRPERAFCLLLVAHVVLAGIGTWLYCRGRGCSVEASLFAAVAFAVSGRVVLHQFAGHPHIGYSAAWLPLVFWTVDRLRTAPNITRAVALGLVLACHFLVGFPMLSLLLAYLLPLYIAIVGPPARGASTCANSRFAALRFALIAAVLALGISAAQILPTLEYMHESHRGGGLNYDWATTSSFPPINLISLPMGGFFGDEIHLPYWGETSLWESTAFCGVAALLLALAAVCRRNAGRETWFWAAAGIVVMLFAMGRYSFVYDFGYHWLPGVKLFRGVGKLSIFSHLAIAVLAGRGFDAALGAPHRRSRCVVFTMIGACALALWTQFERSVDAPPPEFWEKCFDTIRSPGRFTLLTFPAHLKAAFLSKSYGFMLQNVCWSCLILAACTGTLLIGARFVRSARVAMLGLLCLELYLFAGPYLKTSNTAPYLEPSRRLRALLPDQGPWRFCCVSDASDDQLVNQFVYHRFEGIGGVEASLLTRYSTLLQRVTGVEPQLQTYFSLPVVHKPLLNLLNVRYYAAPASAVRIGDSTRDRRIQENVFTKDGKSFDLYENADALPRAFLVHECRSVEYAEFGAVLVPRLLREGAVRATFVEGTEQLSIERASADEIPAESCRIVSSGPTQLRADVVLQKTGLLVVTENFYPGWTARIDGRAARVLPANLAMRAVAVPAGRHTVEMSYEPESFYLGLRICIGTLSIVCGLLVYPVVFRRRATPVSSTVEALTERASYLDRFRSALPVVCSLTYYSGLIGVFFLAGGLLHRLQREEPAPPGGVSPSMIPQALATAIVVIAIGVAARELLKISRRRLAFGTIALAILFPATLALVEVLSRQFTPAWPASGLHGVFPEVAARSWSRVAREPGATGINSWGQRDSERALAPAPGNRRIAFVGDSFLEESTTLPLSVHVERIIDRQNVEVLNLGVSASSPDEYFYRIRNVALPLGASHCVMFVYAGNDFVEEGQSLGSYAGIAAVSPRDSLLQSVGMRGLNHLLANRDRPVIRAWLGAGDLRRQEEYRQLALAEADEDEVRQMLLSTVDATPEQRQDLSQRLSDPKLAGFLAGLRSPENGPFRSYYLSQALWSAARGGGEWAYNSEQAALHWALRAADVCKNSGADFTLVVIPEGCQVDAGMAKFWAPLTDMRRLTRPCRDAADRLRDQAVRSGIDVVDLHDMLQDIPGTYLPLDGHWSNKGAELVAQSLAGRLLQKASSGKAAP
jgi:hypothetical protein